jgi:hypothetical protein
MRSYTLCGWFIGLFGVDLGGKCWLQASVLHFYTGWGIRLGNRAKHLVLSISNKKLLEMS